MSATLLHYSQPMDKSKSLTDMVAYCARVSNPSNQMNTENNEKLLAYMIKHNHWSPFETVSICLEIKTTRDIARQILRHRSFSFQEFSQRYAVVDEPFIMREARLQDKKNRQNSLKVNDSELQQQWEKAQAELATHTKEVYQWALDNNIAKEQARVILPEGMTHSTLYMNGTLRSWIHYIQLRTGVETQLEHRLLAQECAKAIEPIFPSGCFANPTLP